MQGDPMATSSKDFCLSIQDLAALFQQTPQATLAELKEICGPQRLGAYILPEVVRKFIYAKGLRIPSQVISFQMLKGGVAKTTSALNFGLRSAMYGAKVLFIDMDQQANLTFALGQESEEQPVWLDIVERKVTIQQALVAIEPGIDLIGSNLNNSVLDRVLLNGSRNWSQAVIAPLKEIRAAYDLVIIDTAPNLSAINTAVTCASDLVILPINPDRFSLSGVRKHLQDLADLKREFQLQFASKILFTRFDGRESMSREILAQCISEFEDLLMSSYVRTSAEIKNSIGSRRSLFHSKSSAKEDYDLVTKELLRLANPEVEGADN
jgi:chromosome partitioning protein